MPPLCDAQQADQQVQFAGGNEGRAGRQQIDRSGGGGQQRQQADEGVASLLAKPESAQLGKAIGLQIGVAQLPYRAQQRLFAPAELSTEGAVVDPGGKQRGTGGHGG